LVREYDVIVSAPTGSGKTWIAKEAISHELELQHRTWYASPLKALSNSKYLEFGREFGSINVGLLTGDHKINSRAPVLVGTAEILRNHLYDSMTGYNSLEVDLVVLDEAHYLGDHDRGMVWEEILIYMPARVRFLLLSATIDNANELALWMEHNRQRKVRVVRGGNRPVPLVPLYYTLGRLEMLSKAVSQSHKSVKKPYNKYRRSPHQELISPVSLYPILAELNLLPAIFFLKSRTACDQAMKMAKNLSQENPQRANQRLEFIEEYTVDKPYLKTYSVLSILISKGIASHHAGHLPQYKMLVEELMTRNLLSAIFSTSTVAAGVNFPARTVVIPQSDRFDGSSFVHLSATELAQMTGRAGRRSLDKIGFAVILEGPFQDLKLMDGLFNSPPDPVKSVLNVNFSMTLNLLKTYEVNQIGELLSRSLSAWQSVTRHTGANLSKAAKQKYTEFLHQVNCLREIGLVSPEGHLTQEGLVASMLRIDNPLILYQALQAKALPLKPANLAGIVAAFASPVYSFSGQNSVDSPQFSQRRIEHMYREFRSEFIMVMQKIKPIIRMLNKWGYEPPAVFDFQRALAVYELASNNSFATASKMISPYPGDLVRLALLTAEHLNQLTEINDSPYLADLTKAAQAARWRLMVPPIV
ncbi:MAG: DEAD/DEAH box helicase, partial [Deltaproteobacteria bacterium]|nr:DEAD/DEAH box helicase [Deltaproteobacteria bacterium]